MEWGRRARVTGGVMRRHGVGEGVEGAEDSGDKSMGMIGICRRGEREGDNTRRTSRGVTREWGRGGRLGGGGGEAAIGRDIGWDIYVHRRWVERHGVGER